MRKIFTLLLICVFSVGAFGQGAGRTAVIKKASTPPVIGGEIDAVWDEASKNNIDLAFEGDSPRVPSLGDPGETTWQMLWDDAGLYILLRVTDNEWLPTFLQTDGTAEYQNDKPELYFDVNYEIRDGGSIQAQTPGHYQFAPAMTADNTSGTVQNETNGINWCFTLTDPNWTVEYFFPYSYLQTDQGVDMDPTGDIGFDVTIIDRDTGDDDRKRAVWNNFDGSETWAAMDDVGVITLEGAVAPTLLTSIDITTDAGTIDENNGTLQMEYSFAPDDATTTKLSWEVIPVTGRASVSSTGLVTGILDGEVKIAGHSSDGSFLHDTVTVTISNQIVVFDEVNLVRNGNFSKMDDNGYPTEWWGANNAIVSNGYVTLDPPPATPASPWNYRLAQDGFGCNTTDQYTISFVAWADFDRIIYLDFEDPANDYLRYGTSTSEYTLESGFSEWNLPLTTEPTKFVLDVVFDRKVDNTTESMQFQLAQVDTTLYLDSVMLYNDAVLALLTDYTPISNIVISAEDDATIVELGHTLQLSATVTPADADYPDVVWSVVNQGTQAGGYGSVTIDQTGLVTADSLGQVKVMAKSNDDSGITAEYSLIVIEEDTTSVNLNSVRPLQVYPNPAVNQLNIIMDDSNVRTVDIFNSVGQRMQTLVARDALITVDISEYPSGMYFVRSGDRVAKFIK